MASNQPHVFIRQLVRWFCLSLTALQQHILELRTKPVNCSNLLKMLYLVQSYYFIYLTSYTISSVPKHTGSGCKVLHKLRFSYVTWWENISMWPLFIRQLKELGSFPPCFPWTVLPLLSLGQTTDFIFPVTDVRIVSMVL